MSKRFITILIILFFSFFRVPQAIASGGKVLFKDSFNDGNANGWEEHLGGLNNNYGWSVVKDTSGNYTYQGEVVKECTGDYPTYTVNGDIEWGNYSLELKVRGVKGVDKVIFFRYGTSAGNYAINIIGNNRLVLAKNPYGLVKNIQLPSGLINNNEWFTVKIIANKVNIQIYINNFLAIDYLDLVNPILKGKIMLMIWPGAYAGCGGETIVQFDNIVVKEISQVGATPIIILPGLGGSWNTEAILLGEDRPQSEWKMTPFVNIYDNLVGALENAGYHRKIKIFLFLITTGESR
jgi:hypothetical protein